MPPEFVALGRARRHRHWPAATCYAAVAVAENDAGEFRPEIGSIVASAASAARRDDDMPGQRTIFRRKRLGRNRAEMRIVGRGRLSPAGDHQIGAFAVIVLGRVDAAHDREMVHLLGGHRQEFADVNAGDRSRNRRNGPPVAVPGLGSQLSSWLSPPCMLTTSTRRSCDSSARTSAGRPNAPAPRRRRPARMPPAPGIFAGASDAHRNRTRNRIAFGFPSQING